MRLAQHRFPLPPQDKERKKGGKYPHFPNTGRERKKERKTFLSSHAGKKGSANTQRSITPLFSLYLSFCGSPNTISPKRNFLNQISKRENGVRVCLSPLFASSSSSLHSFSPPPSLLPSNSPLFVWTDGRCVLLLGAKKKEKEKKEKGVARKDLEINPYPSSHATEPSSSSGGKKGKDDERCRKRRAW